MKWVRLFFGWLGACLGSVGVPACLAGLLGVWFLHVRLQTPLTEISDTLAEVGNTVEARAIEAAASIQTARDAVLELDEHVTRRTQEVLDLSDADVERIGELRAQAVAIVQRMRDWAAFAGASMVFVEQVMGILESSVGFIQTEPGARADLLSAVQTGRQEIEVAAGLLDEVGASLVELRTRENLSGVTGAIQSLAGRMDSSLGIIQGHAETFSSAVAELTAGVLDLRNRIRGALFLIAAALSFLLVWQAVAQASLMLHGWRLRRPR